MSPCVVGLVLATAVAALAVIIGDRVDLIGLLIVGPCATVISGRGRPTALVAAWAIALAAGIGVVNGIWGSYEHVAFVSAVVVVAATATVAASIIEQAVPSSMLAIRPGIAARKRFDRS
jgi:hypothetical protein